MASKKEPFETKVVNTEREVGALLLVHTEHVHLRRADVSCKRGNVGTGASNVIETVVSALRRKLERPADMIETVRGVGYRAARF
ncbi:winged helix-turn-helix domain-containing protein [Microbacterium deminutum]|uniref:OmpR/PhoB-type domain-containing protein n=1 Tax=Microbacterium deminutum TaxID=344164 RepID=A0ABP5CYP1_9MICO